MHDLRRKDPDGNLQLMHVVVDDEVGRREETEGRKAREKPEETGQKAEVGEPANSLPPHSPQAGQKSRQKQGNGQLRNNRKKREQTEKKERVGGK